jgi:hypothetical protein
MEQWQLLKEVDTWTDKVTKNLIRIQEIRIQEIKMHLYGFKK